jgi:hypothetical protein
MPLKGTRPISLFFKNVTGVGYDIPGCIAPKVEMQLVLCHVAVEGWLGQGQGQHSRQQTQA